MVGYMLDRPVSPMVSFRVMPHVRVAMAVNASLCHAPPVIMLVPQYGSGAQPS